MSGVSVIVHSRFWLTFIPTDIGEYRYSFNTLWPFQGQYRSASQEMVPTCAKTLHISDRFMYLAHTPARKSVDQRSI